MFIWGPLVSAGPQNCNALYRIRTANLREPLTPKAYFPFAALTNGACSLHLDRFSGSFRSRQTEVARLDPLGAPGFANGTSGEFRPLRLPISLRQGVTKLPRHVAAANRMAIFPGHATSSTPGGAVGSAHSVVHSGCWLNTHSVFLKFTE